MKITNAIDELLESSSLYKTKEANLDDVNTTLLHKEAIKKKTFLRKMYLDFYNIFKKCSQDIPPGKKVEIGSGGGFLKETMPGTITSDIMDIPGIDKVFSGENIPFPDKTVSIFYVLDTFHHLSDPLSFLKECNRCLTKRGKVVMIEPANTPYNKFLLKHFHHEPFNDKVTAWKQKYEGPLSTSNQAIPWIVFCRDKRQFIKEFPYLRIKSLKIHTPFRFYLSGGVTRKQLVPSFSYEFFKLIDFLLTPINSLIGSFYTIVLEKRK